MNRTSYGDKNLEAASAEIAALLYGEGDFKGHTSAHSSMMWMHSYVSKEQLENMLKEFKTPAGVADYLRTNRNKFTMLDWAKKSMEDAKKNRQARKAADNAVKEKLAELTEKNNALTAGNNGSGHPVIAASSRDAAVSAATHVVASPVPHYFKEKSYTRAPAGVAEECVKYIRDEFQRRGYKISPYTGVTQLKNWVTNHPKILEILRTGTSPAQYKELALQLINEKLGNVKTLPAPEAAPAPVSAPPVQTPASGEQRLGVRELNQLSKSLADLQTATKKVAYVRVTGLEVVFSDT